MELYFLRHGRSVPRSDWTVDDALRPLTDEGRAAMVREAATLARLGLEPDVILTSPFLRARETAQIAASALGILERLETDDRLSSGFGPKQLRKVLRDHADAARVMLVGHEPDFSQTIGKLTGGTVVCGKGSLVRVDVDDVDQPEGALVSLWQAHDLSEVAPPQAERKAA